MSKPRYGRIRNSIRATRIVLGMTLLAALAFSWFVWGPLGIICYTGGVVNAMWVLVVTFYLALPVLTAVLAFPILSIHAALTWRRQGRPSRRSLVLWIVLTGGFACPMFIGFAGLTTSPFNMYVRGFARYIDGRADVEAIRNWLGTLDPNDYADKYGGRMEKRFLGPELPPVIASLGPKWATVQLDEAEHLMVCLLWGEGMIGHWGIVVGDEEMPQTAPGYSDSSEWRLPLGPGAYVWSDN